MPEAHRKRRLQHEKKWDPAYGGTSQTCCAKVSRRSSLSIEEESREEGESWEAKEIRNGLEHAVGMNTAKESAINS